MSNSWDPPGPNEPNASGTGGYTGGAINVNMPDFSKVTDQIQALTSAMEDLRSTMSSFGTNQHQLGQGVANTLQQVQTSSLGATDSIKTFFQAMTGARPGASSMATILDYGLSSRLPQDLAMFPLRYMQSTIGQNRQFSFNVGGALAGQQYASGVPTKGMFDTLAQTYGSGREGIPTGTGEEIAQFLNIARQAGAMTDLRKLTVAGFPAGGNPRAPGFTQAAYEMQTMNPSMPLGQIASSIGGFVANTAAQRQGAYLTGGAFSMISRGGGVKSISEWSETILRWLEGQRPGGKRGQGFTYEELITQQYPGSNIDAWFDANGVPPDMQEQWWNYALAKARVRSTTTGGAMKIETGVAPGTPNMAAQRLKATQPLTETSFRLATEMATDFASREDINAEFNRLQGGVSRRAIATAMKGPLAFTRNLPDPVEELLMTLLERIPLLGTALGGLAGYGGIAAGGGASLMENLLSEQGVLFGGLLQGGGVPEGLSEDYTSALADLFSQLSGATAGGDIGDWTPQGSTTTASLHPSMNRKVSAMMKANPRIRMNSGRRDEHTQRRLKARGFNRVSGKSSAHTRGLAADLGPRSEYSWITKNAHKYGLRSGAGVGEPWHVGMPGIGDMDIGGTDDDVDNSAPTPPATPTTPVTPPAAGGGGTVIKPKPAPFTGTQGIGALLAMFGGGGGAGADVAGSMGGLMNFLFGQFAGADTGTGTAPSEAVYDPGAARRMFAAGTYATGGTYGGGNILTAIRQAIINRITQGLTNVAAAANTVGGSGATTLAAALTAIGQSPVGLSNGAMVAKLAS